MATSDGCGSAASTGGIRTNVSVTNINCTNTLSSMPSSTMLASDALASISSPISSSTNANNIDITNGANGTTINSIESNTPAMNDLPSHTVNNINNNQSHFYGNGSIRIAVPKMEESDESDTELSQIESTATAAVSMRTTNTKDTPRPMSWEGELSEHDDRMETETTNLCSKPTSSENQVSPVSSVSSNGNSVGSIASLVSSAGEANQKKCITKDEIKPEFNDHNHSTGTNTTNHLSNALYGNRPYPLDMSNMKFETNSQPQHLTNQFVQQQQQQPSNQGDVNSPLLIRSKTNNLLPTNPSPDSAIHSVYTHSSPSQSPLTSRHTPYTPSLSRNNSDASYSSCYSYSSEFSPTHSPIQGRHNMYSGSNFNGSPLHHSVLYKPMIDGNENAKTLQHQQSNESESALEPEILPSAGISRQQLINR